MKPLSTRSETLAVPQEITLFFCGQPGCAHRLTQKPNPMMVVSGGVSAPVWTCPFHGMACSPIRTVVYVPKAASS